MLPPPPPLSPGLGPQLRVIALGLVLFFCETRIRGGPQAAARSGCGRRHALQGQPGPRAGRNGARRSPAGRRVARRSCDRTRSSPAARPIKRTPLEFWAAPGPAAPGPLAPGPGRRGLPRSWGWGRPGRRRGMLGAIGGPAVGDSGPIPAPDRKAPLWHWQDTCNLKNFKKFILAALTRLHTAFQSAPPRALRYRCPSGI